MVLDKELLRSVSEKEVELEHLKTIIVGLNEKLKVTEDITADLENAKAMLQRNSDARKELQEKL